MLLLFAISITLQCSCFSTSSARVIIQIGSLPKLPSVPYLYTMWEAENYTWMNRSCIFRLQKVFHLYYPDVVSGDIYLIDMLRANFTVYMLRWLWWYYYLCETMFIILFLCLCDFVSLPREIGDKTRKSSCVNARGIPPAMYWVLLLLSYLGTPLQGTPQAGYPPEGYPPGRVPPRLDLAGYPPPPRGWTWQGSPPLRCLSHGILGNVAKHYGIWVPPPRGQTEGQTRVKTLPSRRTTYAGGN